MGMDTTTYRGVLVHSNTFVRGLVTSKRKIKKLKERLKKNGLGKIVVFEDDCEPEDACKAITDYLDSTVSCEGYKYSDAYIEDEEVVIDVLQCIADTCSTKELPSVSSVEAFGNYRTTGLWGVDLEKIYIIFEEDDCFVTMVSEKGSNLQRFTGQLSVDSWTHTSY
tara:strand:+ start:812 stop:1309 length:498 start_codon:yes stop_codon:yes gene_type:complete